MSMAWVELQWDIPREQAEILSGKLFAIGALGVQEDYREGEEPAPLQPWDDPSTPVEEPDRMLLKGWWEQSAFEEARTQVSMLNASLSNIGTVAWVPVSQEDWANAWKQHFSRRVFSDALAVSPPWEAQEGDVVLEPGIAFGTGEHPTTASCLEALALWAPLSENQTCLDLGCGSGILALGAAKLGMDVIGVDIETAAIVSANENAKRNGMVIDFSQTDIADIDQQFDVVVANLFAEVLVALSSDILRVSSGYIALAGILASKSQMVEDAFSTLELLRRKQEGDWMSLWYKVPSASI